MSMSLDPNPFIQSIPLEGRPYALLIVLVNIGLVAAIIRWILLVRFRRAATKFMRQMEAQIAAQAAEVTRLHRESAAWRDEAMNAFGEFRADATSRSDELRQGIEQQLLTVMTVDAEPSLAPLPDLTPPDGLPHATVKDEDLPALPEVDDQRLSALEHALEAERRHNAELRKTLQASQVRNRLRARTVTRQMRARPNGTGR